MNHRIPKIIVLFVVLNVAFALVIWSVTGGVLALEASGRGPASVITLDYTPLATLFSPSNHRPDIIFVSVEDAQGKILAHTNPARPGQIRNDGEVAEGGAKAEVTYEDIVVPMSRSKNGEVNGVSAVDHVRVGYMVERSSAMSEPRRVSFPLWALLVAAFAGIPAGAIIAKLIPMPPEPPISDAVRVSLNELLSETNRLEAEIAEHERELARVQAAGSLRNTHLQRVARS